MIIFSFLHTAGTHHRSLKCFFCFQITHIQLLHFFQLFLYGFIVVFYHASIIFTIFRLQSTICIFFRYPLSLFRFFLHLGCRQFFRTIVVFCHQWCSFRRSLCKLGKLCTFFHFFLAVISLLPCIIIQIGIIMSVAGSFLFLSVKAPCFSFKGFGRNIQTNHFTISYRNLFYQKTAGFRIHIAIILCDNRTSGKSISTHRLKGRKYPFVYKQNYRQDQLCSQWQRVHPVYAYISFYLEFEGLADCFTFQMHVVIQTTFLYIIKLIFTTDSCNGFARQIKYAFHAKHERKIRNRNRTGISYQYIARIFSSAYFYA